MSLEVEEMEPLDRELMEELIGEAAAEALEDALDGMERGAPLFVWPGHLDIEGDVSSAELLARCPGFVAPSGATASDRAFTIFIQGDLTVSGVLRVQQYHDVFVQKDVRAKSIVGHTGNLVARGAVSATELIAFACNEEGGLLHGATCEAPLLCCFGHGGWAWAVSNAEGNKEIWEIPGDPDFTALKEALARLGVEPTWFGVQSLVTAGRSTELLRALKG